MKLSKRNCLWCKSEFQPQRPSKKFCSNACRMRDYRKRKAQGIKPHTEQNIGIDLSQVKQKIKQSITPPKEEFVTKDGFVLVDAYLRKLEEMANLKAEKVRLETQLELMQKGLELMQKGHEKELKAIKERFEKALQEEEEKKGGTVLKELINKLT
jgi:hypothetical protein